ncbi:hypothetical protein Y1Q_0012617 [Alligator mississippiensis]|uniref:Uncharacterized protein n=1 Tax=Alligator mississippiensis TaxID=8496 RepID=A0A151M897_ALLMI|nr:hypothetical protein Y1Q_0012617 [Alligator mississippiensis]
MGNQHLSHWSETLVGLVNHASKILLWLSSARKGPSWNSKPSIFPAHPEVCSACNGPPRTCGLPRQAAAVAVMDRIVNVLGDCSGNESPSMKKTKSESDRARAVKPCCATTSNVMIKGALPGTNWQPAKVLRVGIIFPT